MPGRWGDGRTSRPQIRSQYKPTNPFRIGPALQFGLLFTAVVFISKWCPPCGWARTHSTATSLIGGLVDVATVIAPAADMMGSHRISADTAAVAVLLALASNAALKIVIAAALGRRDIRRRG